jgi:two-component system, OmpR family, alkaline phosphatase synthesis response regulator PhoP
MKKDILVVDDEEDILTVFGHIFTELGWEVYTAQNVEDAVTLFKRVTPPLVLTDLRLGAASGVTVCKEIKNIAPLTIVVAMSGFYHKDYSVAHLRRAGFDHLLPKPLKHGMCKKLVDAVTACRLAWDELI